MFWKFQRLQIISTDRVVENFFPPPKSISSYSPSNLPTPPTCSHTPSSTPSPIHSPIHSSSPSPSPSSITPTPNPRKRKRLRVEEIDGLQELIAKKIKERSSEEKEELPRLTLLVTEQREENQHLKRRLTTVEDNLELLRSQVSDDVISSN